VNIFDEEFDERELARALGFMRIFVGGVLFLMPHRSARGWTGEEADEVTTNLAIRGMGARDIAIGIGILTALEKGGSVRGWIEAGVVSDAGDALATLANWRDLRKGRGLFWLAMEAGTAYFGSLVAQELD